MAFAMLSESPKILHVKLLRLYAKKFGYVFESDVLELDQTIAWCREHLKPRRYSLAVELDPTYFKDGRQTGLGLKVVRLYMIDKHQAVKYKMTR